MDNGFIPDDLPASLSIFPLLHPHVTPGHETGGALPMKVKISKPFSGPGFEITASSFQRIWSSVARFFFSFLFFLFGTCVIK